MSKHCSVLMQVERHENCAFYFKPYKLASNVLEDKIEYTIAESNLFSFIESYLYDLSGRNNNCETVSIRFIGEIIDLGSIDAPLYDGKENVVFEYNRKKNRIKSHICSITWRDYCRTLASLDLGRLISMLDNLNHDISIISDLGDFVTPDCEEVDSNGEESVEVKKSSKRSKLSGLNLSGKLISFEGGEGSGKTTQISRLVSDLEKNGYDVLSLREPGGSKIAEEIREVILNKGNLEMTARCEALCFAASRSQLMQEKVLPALETGKVVILDRFVDSSYVYQGLCKSIGVDLVKQINDFATFDKEADLTIYIDVSPEVGFERINANGRETNKYEMMDLGFHKLVRQNYQSIADKYADRIVTVNGEQTKNKVYNDIINVFNNRFRP